ncbi:cation:proton antiporter [Methanobacterium oryzae]|uniref:cation:proton antiporter n=1 Tax=Methanobacterium oryzae TaxID=69540 RepID=UPI003D25EC2C
MIELIFFFIMLLIVAIFSRLIGKMPISFQMIFIVAGMATGWLVTGYVDITKPPYSTTIFLIAEMALVLVLFSDASRVGLKALNNNLSTRLLIIGLPTTIILGVIIATLLFPGVPWWMAGIIGAALAPTDAALGQIVVQNKKVPERIRRTIEIESGLNDGGAVPFLLLFTAIGLAAEVFRPMGYFIQITLEQIGFGALVGLGVGLGCGWLVLKARDKDWITPNFERIAFLSMAILTFLIADELGGSGFIAAFIGGLSLGYVVKDAGNILIDFSETEGQLLNLTVFFLLGIVVLPLLLNITWQIIFYAILSLTVIRMLPVALSLIGTKLSRNSVLFIGWFGPRGLASIVLAFLALEELKVFPGNSIFITVVFVTVLLSVFAHGFTASPLSNFYARRISSNQDKI